MYRLIVIFVWIICLTGCYPEKAFRPGPSGFKNWEKGGASDSDVKKQMLNCGYDNPYYPDKNVSMDALAESQICMFNNGYRFREGYKGLCYGRNWKTKPACVEYRKTHP